MIAPETYHVPYCVAYAQTVLPVKTHSRGLFSRTRQPSERKRKETSAGREQNFKSVLKS